MKSIKVNIILLALLFISFPTAAELYKGTDEEGNVTYSDKPLNNSKKFTPPSLSIIEAPKAVVKEEAVAEEEIVAKPVKFKYKTFKLTSPADEETIWNQPQLMIELSIKPALNTKEGHNIWLFLDGKPIIKNSKKLSLAIAHADRGSHTLQAFVKNKKGKVVKQTKVITVHIKHAVVKKGPQIKTP